MSERVTCKPVSLTHVWVGVVCDATHQCRCVGKGRADIQLVMFPLQPYMPHSEALIDLTLFFTFVWPAASSSGLYRLHIATNDSLATTQRSLCAI
jgi:hypothetical protein